MYIFRCVASIAQLAIITPHGPNICFIFYAIHLLKASPAFRTKLTGHGRKLS